VFSDGYGIRGITYADGKFLMVGSSGGAAYSTDGINWTSIGFSGQNINGVAYGGGMFVGVCDGGYIVYTKSLVAKLMFNPNGSVSWVKG
jgi:hypothetical protein